MTIPSSACPDVGVWRGWLDHEASGPELQDHLAHCPGCRGALADLRGSSAATSSLLADLTSPGLPSPAETARALERVQAARRTSQPTPASLADRTPTSTLAGRIPAAWRVAASGVAAALAVSVLVAFTPGGRTAAASFLAQFRSQEVVAVDITPQTQADLTRTLNTLQNLGTVQLPNGLGRQVAAAQGGQPSASTVSLADARQALGFAVETPDPASLPAGIDRTPNVEVMPASQVRFTFDKNKARAYYQSIGQPEVSLPDKFDGATLVISVPPAVMLQYHSTTAREALVIGEAGELVVDVQGKVSLDELRDFLLGLPGLPQSTVNQLRQIRNWSNTLPIPVPVDKVNWQPTTINGSQGLLLNDNSGVASAAIWHTPAGHLYGVAGSLKARDLQTIAGSLKERPS